MYNLQFTIYNSHFNRDNVNFTVYIVHFEVYNIHMCAKSFIFVYVELFPMWLVIPISCPRHGELFFDQISWSRNYILYVQEDLPNFT